MNTLVAPPLRGGNVCPTGLFLFYEISAFFHAAPLSMGTGGGHVFVPALLAVSDFFNRRVRPLAHADRQRLPRDFWGGLAGHRHDACRLLCRLYFFHRAGACHRLDADFPAAPAPRSFVIVRRNRSRRANVSDSVLYRFCRRARACGCRELALFAAHWHRRHERGKYSRVEFRLAGDSRADDWLQRVHFGDFPRRNRINRRRADASRPRARHDAGASHAPRHSAAGVSQRAAAALQRIRRHD